jgi:hypothetical protein
VTSDLRRKRGDVPGTIAAGGAVLIVGILLGGFVTSAYAIWYLFIKKEPEPYP